MSGSEKAGGGFSPGRMVTPSGAAPSFSDAADVLKHALPPTSDEEVPGLLLLADGSRFEGLLFGARGSAEGELVFTTGMTGFQESLTDPSFAGQVLTFTYPLIGNYGVHLGRSESAGVWPRGVVVRQAMRNPDHRDSVAGIDEFLRAHGVTGIEAIDTRSVTRRVREHGTLLCVIGAASDERSLKQRLAELTPPDLEDLVDEVSIDKPILLNPGFDAPRLAALDCGIKYNILRELCRRFEVLWCPPDISYENLVSDWNIDAMFCSNGPGDPAHPGKATAARVTLAEAVSRGMPTMGICLGHQLLGLACGLSTYKMRYGHRGANQPVLDLVSRTVAITSQNHGFAVEDPEKGMLAAHPSGANSGPQENLAGVAAVVRHVNANDRTVEGLDIESRPAFSVQYHPEACPGPHDAAPLFDRFSALVAEHLRGGE
ncbi:MAG: glutamine-hydrolyzing carbamoyl-phosphate synthase small subunit [Candidatus Poseidoniaceae archaeon]|nr:glutamine-hydrolyzing carbamoyl-phosphate synthase small subunit [Candidatus Poseidoniaceae archaeon]MDP7202981.1 glutamine-hydrolyzing carbamoyl-phosphate synthase small subunit [Candidatus Poseidoniaceae archaeon]